MLPFINQKEFNNSKKELIYYRGYIPGVFCNEWDDKDQFERLSFLKREKLYDNHFQRDRELRINLANSESYEGLDILYTAFLTFIKGAPQFKRIFDIPKMKAYFEIRKQILQ